MHLYSWSSIDKNHLSLWGLPCCDAGHWGHCVHCVRAAGISCVHSARQPISSPHLHNGDWHTYMYTTFLDTLLIIKFSLFWLFRFSLFVSKEKRCMKSALGRCLVSTSGLLVVLRAGNLIQETEGENTPKNPVQKSPVPEIIDPVFAKTSQNARFLLSENERFGLVFVKTGSINSGTGVFWYKLMISVWMVLLQNAGWHNVNVT